MTTWIGTRVRTGEGDDGFRKSGRNRKSKILDESGKSQTDAMIPRWVMILEATIEGQSMIPQVNDNATGGQ